MTNKNSIEYLAYLLDKAKNQKKDKAIVFLGAGASVSAGIPLTNVIIRHIRLKFRKNPLIKNHTLNNITDYYDLMGLLTADERRDLFHFYVTREKVKLNIANIYLAQLLKEGYIDYIVTVNFDDLILKACTLFNFLPPVYDISNIKTITTTDIRTGSVIYLHGQYFGQWLLNNEEELNKVEGEVLSFFNAIKTRRTWVIIGYSGNDGIFEKIKSLGSFSNELFWIKKKLENQIDNHIIEFLDSPNINAHSIEGYYADSFFLKLHAELSKLNEKLNPPDVFYKPFSFLKSVMLNVSDINNKDELHQEVKSILDNCNDRIDKAITSFENVKSIEDFKQKIINSILKDEFDERIAQDLISEIKAENFIDAYEHLSWYFHDWGFSLYSLAKSRNDEKLFNESILKYNQALLWAPNDSSIYNNLGNAFSELAKTKSDDKIYKESIENYNKSISLDPNNSLAYNNLGIALQDLAKLNSDKKLFKESIKNYSKSIELNPKNDSAYNNWGSALQDLARLNSDDKLFRQSFEKYEKAINLSSNNDSAYNNWSSSLLTYSYFVNERRRGDIIKEAKEKAEKAYNLNQDNSYNLACCYALLLDKENALFFLEETLKNARIKVSYIEVDNDWDNFRDDEDFKKIILKYSKK